MIPIIQHRLEWTSSCLMPVMERRDHYQRTDSMTVNFVKNVALYCSIRDLEGVLHTIPGFENSWLQLFDRDGSCVWTLKAEKPWERRRSKGNGPFAALVGMTDPPATKRLITIAPEPKNFKRSIGIFEPSLIVLRGSVLEHYADDFMLRMLDDPVFFGNVCTLWGIPKNMSTLAKAFFKVAHQTSENAAASKVPARDK